MCNKKLNCSLSSHGLESQTINDTLGDIYSAERLRDPYTIKNHIDIRWHFDSDGEEPELDTPYMVKTKNKDGWQKTCIATKDQIKKLENVLKKELSSYDRSMFHNSPDNPKLHFNNSLCKYSHNSRFLEYDCNYWECVQLLYRCVKNINKGVCFDWDKDTLEIIFSW